MQLTKTNFIQFLNCPKSLWILKHEPDEYPNGDFSVFLQKLTREGYEVEGYVQQFLQTDEARMVDFQRVFETDDGLFARADAVEQTASGDVILYEIKSSTSVKTDATHNHIKDAAFQKICAVRTGQRIDHVYLVHLNSDYVRSGDIDPGGLIEFVDVTDKVLEIEPETVSEIDAAMSLLQLEEIDRAGCSCLQKSRGNHCDTFSLLNPDVPTPSIYSLPRLSAKKRSLLVTDNNFELQNVPSDFELTAGQQIVLQAAKTGVPQIDRDSIRDFLAALTFPLYFLDYETFASAVPIVDRASPHKQFPVQYSLHILSENADITHAEYLEREARLPDRLINKLESEIGPAGSIVSWHSSFEKTQNRTTAEWFPANAAFLQDVNDRMVDLEDVFKAAYVDASFDGSTSIKKVLPVICPELGYEDLDVHDGASAMEAWERMVLSKSAEQEKIAESLLRYCERDTLAMVEIYRFLTGLLPG